MKFNLMNLKSLIVWLMIGPIGLMLFSCATIVKGTKQNIPIKSTPADARVFVNGQNMGSTPIILTLKRDKDYRVVFKKEGYSDVTLNIEREFKIGWAIVGNLFSWGGVGIIVDIVDGAAYQLTPEQLNAALTKKGMSLNFPKDKDTIHVVFLTPAELK